MELPAEWRRVYDAMEAQMLAELPDGGELRVMGTLAKLIRLSQLACAAAEVSITIADGPDGPASRPRWRCGRRRGRWTLCSKCSASGPASRWSRSRRRGN